MSAGHMAVIGATRTLGMRRSAVTLLIAVATVLLCSSSASAATEPFGPRFCLSGASAGQCRVVRGVATSPTNGHLYVVDLQNSRVNELTAWGEFVKSWGWGVDDGSSELQVCTTESGCQGGLSGNGVGQFNTPMGIAVDSAGDVYVTDPDAGRVQKFTDEGEFLLMFGGEVDSGPNHPGDLCTAAFIAEGDTCGAGTPGGGDGQFSPEWPFSSNLAIGPGDEVYVGDKGRIQEFDTGGNFVRVLPDPDQVLRNGNPAEDKAVGSVAVDPVSGDLYLAYRNTRLTFESAHPDVYRLDELTGGLLGTLAVNRPSALATDVSGNVYVFDQLRFSGSTGDPTNHGARILKFDSAGNAVEAIAETEIFAGDEIEESLGLATDSFCFGTGENGLYVGARNELNLPKDYVQAFGPTPDPAACPPPDVPPDINGQFASAVETTSATIQAQINPHYFTGAVGTTTYYVQWGTAACLEAGDWEAGCVTEQPVPPGEALDSPPVDEDVITAPIVLSGLSPITTYRYRFVVSREREAGADPPVWIVIGEGGEPEVEGDDADFTTLPEATVVPPCPNDAFRTGAGAGLPDCRAYELVSPLDKAGGDVQARLNIVPFEARVDQASLTGDELTFSAYRAFQDPKSAPFSSQYLTRRTAAGWLTEAISAPQEGEAFINPLIPVDNLYRAFSPDLEQGWLMTDTEPVLGEGGLAGHPNLYRRNSSSEVYDACTTALPQLSEQGTQAPQLEGMSADGDLAVFRVENKLTDDASTATRGGGGRPIYQLYSCSFAGDGPAVVRLVSVLPDGTTSDLENTAGSANQQFQFSQGRSESLDNAVSADGTKVFWTASTDLDASSPGTLYVRLNPGAEPTASGMCEESEPANACTALISAGHSQFWTAADNGSIVIFTTASGQLNEYEVATGETRPIAPEVVGVLGADKTATRVYFLSEADLDGNAVAGQPNLYLHEAEEGTTFIGTLSQRDATQGTSVPSPGNVEPVRHTARVTPDGSAVAFMSNDSELAEEVAGYDNIDRNGGTPAAEIYRYTIGGELVCISCNRTGERPSGRQIQNAFLPSAAPLYSASLLPPWLNALYAPRALSSDGDRIFLESFEALSPDDTNGKADVYQWEAAGKGTCTEAESIYDPQSGGCIGLISSGKSPHDSQFIDASPSGDTVFFRTDSSLVSWDLGQIDIYAARVGGGLPEPVSPPNPDDECKEEGCPSPVAPPPNVAPLQTAQPGPGNVHPGEPRKHCRKGTHRVRRKGKALCVKNRKGKRAGKSRRAG